MLGIQISHTVRRVSWGHLIVDEGHRLKNAGCKLAQELAFYRAPSRLLLTGQPPSDFEFGQRVCSVVSSY